MKSKNQNLAESTPDGGLRVGPLQFIVGYLLAQAAVATDQVFNGAARSAAALRPVEFTVLALVHANPQCTAGQLAKALAMTPPNITAWLDKLAARGCIERARSESDRRAQHVSVTPQGARLVERTAAAVAEAEAAALAGLSAGERAMLQELLHKVARARQHRRSGPAVTAAASASASAPATPAARAVKLAATGQPSKAHGPARKKRA